MCVPDVDPDWPTKPFCLGEAPVKSPLGEMKKAWDGYYQYKGEEWMKMKKAEMDSAIRDGTLQEWIDLERSNRNAFYYYWINGKAPSPAGVTLDEVFDTSIDKTISFMGLLAAISGVATMVLIIKKRRSKIRHGIK